MPQRAHLKKHCNLTIDTFSTNILAACRGDSHEVLMRQSRAPSRAV